MTREELDFIGSMNMCDEISNEAYKKIVCHCREQEPCPDAISRQAAIDAIEEIHPVDTEYDCTLYDKIDVMYVLTDLPPVNPQPKIGHWVDIDEEPHEDYECDNCGFIHTFIDGHTAQYNYCPNCGARMVEPQESEDKE